MSKGFIKDVKELLHMMGVVLGGAEPSNNLQTRKLCEEAYENVARRLREEDVA